MKKENEIPNFTEEDLVSANIGKGVKSSLAKQAMDIEGKHSNKGFILSLLLVIFGIICLILGVSGIINLSAEMKGFKLTLLNCSPGVFLIIIGAFIYWISKPKIKIH